MFQLGLYWNSNHEGKAYKGIFGIVIYFKILKGDVMKMNSIKRLKCLHCGAEWIPRKAITTVCAKCKSPYFDKPRKEKKAKPKA